MPVGGSMMWRFSSLFNYIRGSVRSGVWRVRETPSQLLSDDRDDRDERDEQKSEVPATGGSPPPPPPPHYRQASRPPPTLRTGLPIPTPPRSVTSDLPSPHRPCGVGALPGPHGPLGGGLPGPASVRLPSTAALWYIGLADQSTAAAATSTVSATAATTTTIAGASVTTVCSTPTHVTVTGPVTGPVTATASPVTVPVTAHVTATAPVTATAVTAPVTIPVTIHVAATSPVTAHVVTLTTDPVAPADPASSAPSDSAPASDTSADESEPLDSLSSLRVSFAAEHDRLMASLQNAAGASVATSRPRQALECFRTAAALGSPAAWFNCGVFFQEGRGTDVDLEKAAVCYEEAARLGHTAAGYNLALLAAAGRLMTSHYDVTGLLERAAAAGSGEAAAFLETWRSWREEQETETDAADGWLSLSPPGRSVSLPVLRAGYAPESDPDLESCCTTEENHWPAVRPPALFYLHESP